MAKSEASHGPCETLSYASGLSDTLVVYTGKLQINNLGVDSNVECRILILLIFPSRILHLVVEYLIILI